MLRLLRLQAWYDEQLEIWGDVDKSRMTEWLKIFGVEYEYVSLREQALNCAINFKELNSILIGGNSENFKKNSPTHRFILVRQERPSR